MALVGVRKGPSYTRNTQTKRLSNWEEENKDPRGGDRLIRVHATYSVRLPQSLFDIFVVPSFGANRLPPLAAVAASLSEFHRRVRG